MCAQSDKKNLYEGMTCFLDRPREMTWLIFIWNDYDETIKMDIHIHSNDNNENTLKYFITAWLSVHSADYAKFFELS